MCRCSSAPDGGITPTLVGRNVLRLARTILEEFETLIATAKSTRSGESGRLAIGFCTSLTAGNLRSSLLEFKKAQQIELAIVERSRTQLATALRNGVLDVLIVTGGIPIVGGNTLALWSERIQAVVQEDHRLTSREVVYWTDLRDETVLLSQGNPAREIEDLLVSKLIRPEGRPRIERHDISHGVIKSLVMMKLGISLVLESDMGTNFSGLKYREFRDGTGPSRLDYSAYWRADNDNPALESFLKLLSSRYPATSLGR